MFEFGKYAGAILGSYGSFFVLLVGFLLLSMNERKKVRRDLDRLESEQ